MVQFNVSQREITLKVVYYGPPLSGKTTNLQAIHRTLSQDVCGRLTTLDTADDRTLFFDMLPVVINAASGYSIKLKLFTVPGQVVHAATRRLVLSGADGVVFVADSQVTEARLNNEYWHGMHHYMEETGIDAAAIPTVIQFNKRDLANIRTDAELDEMQQKSPEPLFRAVAVRNEGVIDTLAGLLELMFADLNRRCDFERKFNISSGEFMAGIIGPLVPSSGDLR